MTPPVVTLEEVFNEARCPEVTFVLPKQATFIRSSIKTHGKHITITGPSGSGKTTLITTLLKEANIANHELFILNGRAFSNFESYEQLLATAIGCGAARAEIDRYLVANRFIVIDDFHHLSPNVRQQISKELKLWHESGIRFILIGIASSHSELTGGDAELGIRNDPFEIKTQDPEFVLELIAKGEKALNFTFSEELRNDIVQTSNGVPSIVQVICRMCCVATGISDSKAEKERIVSVPLKEIREPVLRIFHGKYFDKVVGLAKGKQQARSVHNTYFDIIKQVARNNRTEFAIEGLRSEIVGPISDPKERARKSTSFQNCLNNFEDIITEKGLSDMIVYRRAGTYISIEDPSFRFYLNLLDMKMIETKLNIRSTAYPYDVALSFAGQDRGYAVELANELKKRGMFVFYDFDLQAQLWGKDLSVELADVYSNQSCFMIVIISANYPQKDWTNFELEVGKLAADKRTDQYLLPIRLDNTPVVGLKGTIAHLNAETISVPQICDLMAEKLEQHP